MPRRLPLGLRKRDVAPLLELQIGRDIGGFETGNLLGQEFACPPAMLVRGFARAGPAQPEFGEALQMRARSVEAEPQRFPRLAD